MLWNSKKNKQVLYKDNLYINQRSKYLENCKELANLIKKAKEEQNYFKYFLDDSKVSKQYSNPEHQKCDMPVDGSNRMTEKRICRCMYYYGENIEKCEKCPLKQKYKNVSGRFKVIDYEVPMLFVTDDCGGIDLLIEDIKSNEKYAVEVKPKNSSETLVRMIAEIFTYTANNIGNYKRAIAFFKGSQQEQDYFNAKYNQNEDFNYILSQVTVFRIIEKEVSLDKRVIEYDIEMLDRN